MVLRSEYYKWLNRIGHLNRYETLHRQLDMYVKDIHAHYPSVGYRQIRDTMQLQTGWKVCDWSPHKFCLVPFPLHQWKRSPWRT